MYRALVERDSAYDGVFVAGIRTTMIFCRPGCAAKKPREENGEFFASTWDALAAGYRPCKRCAPLEPQGRAPGWLSPLIERVENDPSRRWTDADLRSYGIDPSRVRRWFRTNHGMTFHAYQRARRLGLALGRIHGGAGLSRAAYDHGYESESGFRDAFRRLFGSSPGRSGAVRPMVVTRVLTPLGPMVAGAVEEGLCLLEFADRRMLETQVGRLVRRLDCVWAPGSNEHISRLVEELAAYFVGTLDRFTVPLVMAGTEFQTACWTYLISIPYGETRSYDDEARALGRSKAVRAVGRANGDNRIALLIPCHRVVRRDGQLAGYGGGVWRKRLLLGHERGRSERVP